MTVESQKAPDFPVPSSCPSWYTQKGIYSNISNLTTLYVPYTDEYDNSMSLVNEFEVLSSWLKKYYKVFLVNGVKIGWVMYKTVSPNNDYYWSFTVCVED